MVIRAQQFSFIVTVQEDGVIDVDWSNSYIDTIDAETGDILMDGEGFPEILDAVLGYIVEPDGTQVVPSMVKGLRNLANYIEEHP